MNRSSSIQLNLMTPDNELFNNKCLAVNVPASDGYLGIYQGHAPLISSIGVGIVRIDDLDKYFVAYGLLRINDDRVEILADVAEQPDTIDIVRATASKDRALNRLREAHRTAIDIERANASLQRALNRLSFSSRPPNDR